ncbi:alpha/beta fold hydrolase [Ensifer soli]|uniref:alpha/beta fold hydrolase n=1 Tax=Ciceribacter sp. sgz301302 TaxID=3342379 RepID=UPI0035B93AB5
MQDVSDVAARAAALHATPDNPVPSGAAPGRFFGEGGLSIRHAIFRPALSRALGTVVLLQGRNETIEKYYETIAELTAAGLCVATFDWRGQGGSGRLLRSLRRGHVRRFADYERDLVTFLDTIVLPDTPPPYFILAHSMGGLIALSLAPMLASRIERMVLAAPFTGLGAQILGERMIRSLAGTATLAGLGMLPLTPDRAQRGFEVNLLTSDRRRFERNLAIFAAHPELALGPPTARWLHETFGAMRRVLQREHLHRITIPTLILAPSADLLVPHASTLALAERFRAGHLVVIDGARHELLQEADRYRAPAMAGILSFIPGSDAPPETLEA